MKKMYIPLVVICLLLLGTNVFPVHADASRQLVNWEIAGSLINSISALDLTGAPETAEVPAVVIAVTGKGRPGTVAITGLSYALPSSDKSACPSTAVAALQVVENPIVATFSDLSMVYANVATQGGGWICLSADGTTQADITLQLTGGSKRYAGATGNLRLQVSTQIVGRSLLAEYGTITGEIALQK